MWYLIGKLKLYIHNYRKKKKILLHHGNSYRSTYCKKYIRILLNISINNFIITALIYRYIHLFQVVLSACSSYFQKLLLENPCKHPTIIMPQDVCYADLKFIIEFVYKGEIDVSQAELQVGCWKHFTFSPETILNTLT